MKTLLGGYYSPKGTLRYYERALEGIGEVTYCGVPYRFERPGYAPDANLAEIASRGAWDWYFYVEEWKSVFPLGINEVPFPTVGYFPDACYDIPRRKRMASFFDYVFISQQWLVGEFRAVNPHTYYLPFAFDPGRLQGFSLTVEPIFEVGFVGSLDKERARMLGKLSKRFKMNDYRADSSSKPLEYATEVYLHSKIVFNRLPLGYKDYNLRVFEALGLKRFLITDRPSAENPLLKHRKHLAYYECEDDLVELVNHHLGNDREREAIAEEGHREVMGRHTYDHRVQRIWEILVENGFRMQAPLRKAHVDAVFLGYQKVFGRLMMLDSMANLFTQPEVSFTARLRALPYVVLAVLHRLRQMCWRKLVASFLTQFRRNGN